VQSHSALLPAPSPSHTRPVCVQTGLKRGLLRIDWLGSFLSVACLVPLLLAISWGGNGLSWGSTTIVLLFVGGTLVAALFVFVELRVAAEPAVPLRFFRSPHFTISNVVTMLMPFGFYSPAHPPRTTTVHPPPLPCPCSLLACTR